MNKYLHISSLVLTKAKQVACQVFMAFKWAAIKYSLCQKYKRQQLKSKTGEKHAHKLMTRMVNRMCSSLPKGWSFSYPSNIYVTHFLYRKHNGQLLSYCLRSTHTDITIRNIEEVQQKYRLRAVRNRLPGMDGGAA